MSYSKIKSYAKINLALNVVGKMGSLHKIESIVSFMDLHDEIFIKKIINENHKIKFNIYTLYWFLFGTFRGLKNLIFKYI